MDTKLMAEKIRQRLSELGINQAELSRRAGITRGALSQILNGDRTPSTPAVMGLAEALVTSCDHLLGRVSGDEIEDMLQNERVRTLVKAFLILNDQDQRRILDMVSMLQPTAR